MTLDTTTGREEVLAELRSGDKFLLTTHENPDGDALGSLVAMNEILRALGKDTVMFMSEEEFPLPYEYRWLPLDGACHALPADAEERTIVFLDCGNIDRMPVSFLRPRRRAHREHRPPPRQHPLRHREPGRGRRVVARPRSSGT